MENETITQEVGALEDTAPITYTQEEVQQMIQSEADRRVSQALKTQQAKFERQQSEAEKLRGMDEAQRRDYEFELKVKALEEKERQFAITQNKLEASKVLAERGLPVNFVDYLVAEDADTMLANINSFETMFKGAVADAVSAKLSTGTPKSGNFKQTGLTREEFLKMNITQKSELYNTNPALYKELAGR